jgi:hypothetical protein
VICMKCLKLIVKYFFLADFFFGGLSILDLDKYISTADIFYLGGHLRL